MIGRIIIGQIHDLARVALFIKLYFDQQKTPNRWLKMEPFAKQKAAC